MRSALASICRMRSRVTAKFCPTCGNLLMVEPGQRAGMQFACQTCPYVHPLGAGGKVTKALTLGRKDAILDRQDRDLTELRSIVGDLVKSQVLGAANDQKHGEALQQVANRLDRLEGRR